MEKFFKTMDAITYAVIAFAALYFGIHIVAAILGL